MAKQNLTVELFYSGSWHSVPAYVRNPVTVTRIRAAGSEPTPFTAPVTLRGFYNPKNPRSPLYGAAGQNTPVRIKLGSEVRFYGEVASWEPQRSINYDAAAGKGDAWTDITAAGILRRLGQGTDPFRSPLFRSMSGVAAGDYVPHAYWPMEEGTDATRFASGLPSVDPMTFTGSVSPAADDTLPGSAALPEFAVGAKASFTVPTYTDTGEWVVQFVVKMTATSASLFEITADGTAKRIVVGWNFGTQEFSVTMTNAAGGTVYSQVWPFVAADVTGRFLSISFGMSSNSGGTDQYNMVYQILGDPVQYGAGDPVPGLKGRITGGQLLASTTATTVAGHLGVFVDPNFSQGIDSYYNAQAMGGWAGELAHERIERLCREEGIPLTVDGAVSQAMGVQPRETLLNLFAEAERTDDGILLEPRDSYGLVYRCGRERYNRPVALALDYAAHEVAPPLRPVLDDLASRNDVTATRRNGGSARAVLEAGPLSVQAPPDGIGRYTTRVDVNTSTDDVLPHHARWHLHKGTIDEVRYATVTVDLDASPALAADASAVDIGDVITIANLPEEDGVDLARLTVLGYTETIGSHRRLITFTCIPATTFDVGVWGSNAKGSRYGASTSTLAAAATSSATTLFVDPGTDTWATTTSHPTRFPFDITLGGLTYACSAIGNSADDSFNGRTTVSSWGTSSGGQVWTTSGGSAGDYAVGGGFGEITSNTAAVLRYVTMPIVSSQIEVMVNARWPSIGTATGASLTSRLLWGTDLSNHYEAAVSLTTSGTLTLTLSKRIAGVGSTMVAATLVDTYTANQVIWIRLQRSTGGLVRASAWNSSGTGLVTTLETTDTSITNGQIIAVGCRRETGNTNAAALLRWDTLTVTHPYKATVTRLADDKTHSAGDPVTVTDTGRYGL